jgi:hemerythrin-like metal-binding protein
MAEPALAAFTAASAERIKLALADASARWHAGERSATRRVTAVELRHKNGHKVAGEVVTTLRGDASGPHSVLGISREVVANKSAKGTADKPAASRAYAPPADADGSQGSAESPLRFHWRSAYECGLPALDREHRTLFENASDLLDTALERERDPARFMAAVDRLLSNVQQHFADEEALLQRIAYPDLVAHTRRHRELVLQATHLREEARAGRISIGDWTEFVANDVVVGHLIREDRKFFPLLALATADGIAADSDTTTA